MTYLVDNKYHAYLLLLVEDFDTIKEKYQENTSIVFGAAIKIHGKSLAFYKKVHNIHLNCSNVLLRKLKKSGNANFVEYIKLTPWNSSFMKVEERKKTYNEVFIKNMETELNTHFEKSASVKDVIKKVVAEKWQDVKINCPVFSRFRDQIIYRAVKMNKPVDINKYIKDNYNFWSKYRFKLLARLRPKIKKIQVFGHGFLPRSTSIKTCDVIYIRKTVEINNDDEARTINFEDADIVNKSQFLRNLFIYSVKYRDAFVEGLEIIEKINELQ